MTRVIMYGCNGKMGQTITRLIEEENDVEIVAGIDVCDTVKNSYPVFQNIADCDVEADVVIDFSSPVCTDALLDWCADKQVPVVECTTGLSEAQLAKIKETSAKVAVLKSANMSMGINLLEKLLKEAAGLLAEAGYDIEIVEKHHKLKKDAPSGLSLIHI